MQLSIKRLRRRILDGWNWRSDLAKRQWICAENPLLQLSHPLLSCLSQEDIESDPRASAPTETSTDCKTRRRRRRSYNRLCSRPYTTTASLQQRRGDGRVAKGEWRTAIPGCGEKKKCAGVRSTTKIVLQNMRPHGRREGREIQGKEKEVRKRGGKEEISRKEDF